MMDNSFIISNRRKSAPDEEKKKKHKNNNRYWYPEMENIALRIMQQANNYAWMYSYMAANAKYLGDLLNITSGILGGIVGTAGVVTLFLDTTTPLWARLIQIIIGFLVTIVSVLTSTWRLTEMQMNDNLTQVSYSILSKEIMWQLAQPRKDRHDAREYIKSKLGEIEQLKVSAPIIDKNARKAFLKKFKNMAIDIFEEKIDEKLINVIKTDDSKTSSSESDEDEHHEEKKIDPLQILGTLIIAYEVSKEKKIVDISALD